MPIVRVPDIGLVRFPDDMPHDEIVAAIENDIVPNYKKPTGGVLESLKGGFKHGEISGKTALKSIFGDEDAAATEALAEHAAVRERPPVSLDEIKRKYAQEGLLPAAKETISQIPSAIAAQAPTLAEMYAGAKLGKTIGGAPGALIGSVAAPFLMNTGSNIERQAEEQQAAEQPIDVSVPKALAAAVPQTAIERMLGVEGSLFGRGAVKEGTKEAAEALAKESTLKGLLKGTGKVGLEEAPEEVGQAALERLQAGLPVTGDEAYDEYKRAALEAAMVGPMGGPLRLMEQNAARQQLSEEQAPSPEQTPPTAEQTPAIPEVQQALPILPKELPAPETRTAEAPQTDAEKQAQEAQAQAQAQAQADEAQQAAAQQPIMPEPAVQQPTVTLAKKLGINPLSNLGKSLNQLDTSDPNNAVAASDMLRAAENTYKGKINQDAVNEVHAVADQLRPMQPQQQAPEAAQTPTTPEVEAVETKAPEVEAVETKAPEVEAVETKAPEVEAMETKAPEVEAMETKAPEVEAMEAKAPEVEAPALDVTALNNRIEDIDTLLADKHLLDDDEVVNLRKEKAQINRQLAEERQKNKVPEEDAVDNFINAVLAKVPKKTEAKTADIQKEVNKHIGNTNFVNVVQSVKDLPGEGHHKDTQGWFDEDTQQVHLVADNLKPEHVKNVLLHEIGVHRNLKNMVGEDRYNTILADLQRRLNKKDPSVVAAQKAVPKDTPTDHIPEEILAYLVEHGDKSSHIKGLLSHIKEAVHKLTGIKFKLNDTDLRHLASKALRHELEGGTEVSRRKTGKGKASVATSKVAEDVLRTPYTVQRKDEDKGSWKEKINTFADKLMKEHVDKWNGIANIVIPIYGEYVGEKLNAAYQGHYYDQAHNVLARGYSTGGFKIRPDGTPEVTKVSYKRHDGSTGYASLQHMQELADHIDAKNGRAIVSKIMYIKDAERQMRLDPKKLPTQIKEDMQSYYKARRNVNELLREQPEYKDILSMWDALNENLINFSFDSGLINTDTKAIFLREKGYLPRYMLREQIMDRLGPDDKSATQIGNTYTKVFRERTESDHAINPWENMSRHYTGVVMGGWNNLVKTAVAEQMTAAGRAEKVGNTKNPKHKGDMAIMKDGKREFYKLSDPTDMPVMIFLNQELGPLMKVARGSAKVLRVTSLNNPAYWARQIIRDPIQASLTTGVGMITPAHTMRELLSITQGTNEIYNKLKDVGVIGHVDPVADPRFSKEFTQNIGRAAAKKGTGAKALRGLANMSEATHVAVDGATRVAVYKAAYKQAKKKGFSDQKAESYAIMKARESINFSVSGSSQRSRELRILIPFMSAGVNSLQLLYNAAFNPRVSSAERAKAIQQFRSKAGMMAMMSAAYALMMAGDDDYEQQDDNFRYNNILVPTGDPYPPYMGLSLPPDLAFIKWVPEMMVRYAFGTQDGAKILKAAGSQLQAMVPGGMGYTYGVPVPQVVRPYLEGVVFGKSAYTGENIESRADMGKPVAERGAKKASETANFLSKDMGLSHIGLSPAVIDHLFRGYLSEMGKVGLWLADKVTAPAGAPEKATMDWAKTPGLGLQGLFGRSQGSQFVSDMYDNKELADQARKHFNDLKKEHTPDKRAELKELFQDKEEMAKVRSAERMDKYAKRITVLNKRIEMIQNSSIDPDLKQERIRGIKENINKIALQADDFWQGRVVKAGE